jgi:hypothetical protein
LLEPRMGLGSEIFKSMESKVSISMSFSFWTWIRWYEQVYWNG